MNILNCLNGPEQLVFEDRDKNESISHEFGSKTLAFRSIFQSPI